MDRGPEIFLDGDKCVKKHVHDIMEREIGWTITKYYLLFPVLFIISNELNKSYNTCTICVLFYYLITASIITNMSILRK